jgi:FlaA1/EpsC-like NDP-sugar epimerase
MFASPPSRPNRAVIASISLDAASWVLAIVFAEMLRYDFQVGYINLVSLALLCVATVAVNVFAGFLFYLYRGRYLPGSFDEARIMMVTVVVSGLLVGFPVVGFGNDWDIPRSTVFIALPIAAVLMSAARFLRRAQRERDLRPRGGQRALIYGAGQIGVRVARALVSEAGSSFLPVGFIDDDPKKSNMVVAGVPVLGNGDNLERIISETRATVLLIAIVFADATLLRELRRRASDLGLTVKVVPSYDEMLTGRAQSTDLRDISLEDLIGRVPMKSELGDLLEYLHDKRVLVTGAGGSIGSELCRQISMVGPAALLMLDRDESGLQQTQLAITGHGLLTGSDLILADIRDSEAIRTIFSEKKPDVVFHAAALKHLTMLENFPSEAWKTNVLGTLNLLEAAAANGVSRFVNISTDKAANPTSVLGRSKLLTEQITAWFAETTLLPFVSVRFGNVLGSRGSLIPLLTSQIQAGGPVTITHPEMTRYFMTISEACHLVLRGGAFGRAGEVLILDMGNPVRIMDVAEQMIELSGEKIDIVFTGIRPGEKLDEELFVTGEILTRPFHTKISHSRVIARNPATLQRTLFLQNQPATAPADANG